MEMDKYDKMEIEDRIQIALDCRQQGYNCSQAVVASYIDMFDTITFEQAMMISYGFGGGVGATREICGTLTGAAMLLGLKYGKKEADPTLKSLINQKIAAISKEFEIKRGSVVCGELLGLRTSDKTINKATCNTFIVEVIQMLEKYLYD